MASNKIIATHMENQPAPKAGVINLRAPGLLAKYPRVGIILFIMGSLVFGALTVNLEAHGPLLAWDNLLANTLPAIGLHSPPFIKSIVNAGFFVGEQVITVFNILLAIYFMIKRYWQEFTMLTVGQLGSFLIFFSLSNFIARPRPPTQIWIVLHIPGFPSGHAIGVIVFYGLMAYLLAPKMPSTFWKVVVIAAAIFIMAFVGFSRVFTGGHYLTDVLAGYAVGIAWCGLIYPFIELCFQKRNR
jgi:membrane-associated phospholipid phosphatase